MTKEYIVKSNGHYSPLLTHMMNKHKDAPQPQRDDTALLRECLEALEACLGWPHVIEKLKERLG